MDRHDVSAVRMTATSAARDAANSDDFFDAAEAAVGVRPELISGDEEGKLSFAGATAELDPADGPFLVVDIGGGSTERSEEHTSELQSLMRISYAVFCLKKKNKNNIEKV